MKTVKFSFISFALLAAGAVVAQAQPELVISKDGAAYTVDFANETGEPITAMMFSIKVGSAVTEDKVDLSNCTVGLPRTHVGFCQFNPGVVKVVIYSGSNAELPTVGNIGTIQIAEANRRDQSRAQMRSTGAVLATPKIEFSDAVFSRTDGSDIQGVILQ